MCAQSPERLQKRIEELQEAVTRERQLVSAAEQRMREVQGRLDTIARVRAWLVAAAVLSSAACRAACTPLLGCLPSLLL